MRSQWRQWSAIVVCGPIAVAAAYWAATIRQWAPDAGTLRMPGSTPELLAVVVALVGIVAPVVLAFRVAVSRLHEQSTAAFDTAAEWQQAVARAAIAFVTGGCTILAGVFLGSSLGSTPRGIIVFLGFAYWAVMFLAIRTVADVARRRIKERIARLGFFETMVSGSRYLWHVAQPAFRIVVTVAFIAIVAYQMMRDPVG